VCLFLAPTAPRFPECLHEAILEEVLVQKGGNIYREDQVRYCLTVPAMWTDKAKNLMRRAATKAGIIQPDDHRDRLMLVSEPEAAALYCEKHCGTYKLGPGDRFLICDDGGGTVDLVFSKPRQADF
jgi:molecular chaperone DnaK (HSP70)